MISLYYAFSTRTSFMGLSFMGPLHIVCRLISQPTLPPPKSSATNYLENHPQGHVTTYFKELQIMPIDMLYPMLVASG